MLAARPARPSVRRRVADASTRRLRHLSPQLAADGQPGRHREGDGGMDPTPVAGTGAGTLAHSQVQGHGPYPARRYRGMDPTPHAGTGAWTPAHSQVQGRGSHPACRYRGRTPAHSQVQGRGPHPARRYRGGDPIPLAGTGAWIPPHSQVQGRGSHPTHRYRGMDPTPLAGTGAWTPAQVHRYTGMQHVPVPSLKMFHSYQSLGCYCLPDYYASCLGSYGRPT